MIVSRLRIAFPVHEIFAVLRSMPPVTRSHHQHDSHVSTSEEKDGRKTIAIVGTGWAGWTLAQELDDKKYKLIVISKERTMALTPLLASASCGIFDFRNAEEPVRRRDRHFMKYQAVVQRVNFEKKRLNCRSAVEGFEKTDFEVQFDTLVLAPGCATNTFGTEGVAEYAYFMRNVQDAMKLRARILDVFELASLPTISHKKRKELLHIGVVGGGPTGVELVAEIDDLINDHLLAIYPHLKGFISLTLYDVAPEILSPFDKKLGEYAVESFQNRNVNIKTSTHIQKVEKDALYIKEEGRVPYGIIIWATGNQQVPLLDTLNVKKSDGLPRILTDRHLRVLKKDDSIFDDVYALGDAADIEGQELPTTAEVAVQKAKYLANYLNRGNCGVFEYKQKQLVAYIGGRDGVVAGSQDWTGVSAWLAWRSGTLSWSRSWRRRFMILMNYLMNWTDGRELARK